MYATVSKLLQRGFCAQVQPHRSTDPEIFAKQNIFIDIDSISRPLGRLRYVLSLRHYGTPQAHLYEIHLQRLDLLAAVDDDMTTKLP